MGAETAHGPTGPPLRAARLEGRVYGRHLTRLFEDQRNVAVTSCDDGEENGYYKIMAYFSTESWGSGNSSLISYQNIILF